MSNTLKYVKEIHSLVGKMSACNILQKLLNSPLKTLAFWTKPANEIQPQISLEDLIRNINRDLLPPTDTEDDLYDRLSAFVSVFPYCLELFSDQIRAKLKPLSWREQHQFNEEVKLNQEVQQKIEQAMKGKDEAVRVLLKHEDDFGGIVASLKSEQWFLRRGGFFRAAATVKKQNQQQKQQIIGEIQKYIPTGVPEDIEDIFCQAIGAYLSDYPEKEIACKFIQTTAERLLGCLRNPGHLVSAKPYINIGACFNAMSANPLLFSNEASIQLAEAALAIPRVRGDAEAAAISFLIKVYDGEKIARFEMLIAEGIKALAFSGAATDTVEPYIKLFVEIQEWKEYFYIKPQVGLELENHLPPPLCRLILAF